MVIDIIIPCVIERAKVRGRERREINNYLTILLREWNENLTVLLLLLLFSYDNNFIE